MIAARLMRSPQVTFFGAVAVLKKFGLLQSSSLKLCLAFLSFLDLLLFIVMVEQWDQNWEEMVVMVA